MTEELLKQLTGGIRMNRFIVAGEISSELEISHKIHGETMYKMNIDIMRKSGCVDTLPCVIPEVLISDITTKGNKILILGELRTRNVPDATKKLNIYLFVKEIDMYPGHDCNDIELDGYVCKATTYRKTPLGREISDMIIACNRDSCHKSDYIPCIAWGRNAIKTSEFEVGSKVKVFGRLQSREYVKKIEDGTEETRVAYELSSSRIDVVEESEGEE